MVRSSPLDEIDGMVRKPDPCPFESLGFLCELPCAARLGEWTPPWVGHGAVPGLRRSPVGFNAPTIVLGLSVCQTSALGGSNESGHDTRTPVRAVILLPLWVLPLRPSPQQLRMRFLQCRHRRNTGTTKRVEGLRAILRGPECLIPTQFPGSGISFSENCST